MSEPSLDSVPGHGASAALGDNETHSRGTFTPRRPDQDDSAAALSVSRTEDSTEVLKAPKGFVLRQRGAFGP
jgi:hypothetical protein